MRRRLLTPGILAWLALLTLAPLALAQDRVLTPDLILTIQQVADARISPDGSRIALQIQRPREEGASPGGAISQLWLVPSGGGDPVQLTTSEEGSRAPRWSPDGDEIAFLSRRPESEFTQVYVLPMGGGEARRLTNAAGPVGSFKWSPDAAWIAYTVTDPKTPEDVEAERQGRDWIVADQNYRHTRLHAIEVASGASHVITTTPLTIHEFDWAPDSSRLVIAAADTPTVDDSFMKIKVMTVARSGGTPALVAATEGKLTDPAWSPDGRWIAWLGATELSDPYAGRVYVAPADGGTPEPVTPDYQGTATWLSWLPGATSTLVFVGVEGQSTSAYTLALPRQTRMPLPLGDVILLGGMSVSGDGTRVAFSASTPAHPYEAYGMDVGSDAAPRRLTTLNPQLDGVKLGAQEVVRWKSVDGREMEGVIVKPVGYQSGVRYPLVMQPHGGPESADLNGWTGTSSRWGQMLAGRGFVTFYPNYRGSIGRGPAFAMADHRDLMGLEFQDMLSGIEHLVSTGLVDRERVGVGGGSYGGYTSAWAATYGSEHFRAAVMWMGISNWYSMTGTSDIFFENSTVHWNAMMYDNYALYWDRSPLAHIDKANTPTLIIHGAEDPRVPIGQSQEMYTALKWKGVPVEFVTYPREGHGVSERAHQEDFMRRVLAWFETYLAPSAEPAAEVPTMTGPAGGVDPEGALADVREQLGRWQRAALEIVSALAVDRRDVEAQASRLESPADILAYVDFFSDFLLRAAANVQSIEDALAAGPRQEHVETLRRLADAGLNEQRRPVTFRDRWINRTLPYEQVRPLLTRISTVTRDALASCRDLERAADALAQLIGPPAPPPSPGEPLDRRALFNRLLRREGR